MAGIVIAFQKFNPAKGLFGDSPWVGLDNFKYIFSLPSTRQVVINTLILSISKIILGTLLAIVVALLLNECRNRVLKRSVQTMIYFPYFISWIILAGMLSGLLSPNGGIVNQILNAQLLAQGFDDGTDEQRAEKTLRHSAQCVNAVAPQGNLDVFSCQKLFHRNGLIPLKINMLYRCQDICKAYYTWSGSVCQ